MARPAIDSHTLLEGPRGRRVCWALMGREGAWWWRDRAPESDGPARLAEVLRAEVDRVDVDAIAAASDPVVFWEALEDSVYAAMYWQEPDACDRRLAHPDVSAALAPIAHALSSSAAAEWWTTPLDPDQWEVSFDRPELDVRSERVDPAAALGEWRARTLDDERRAEERPDDLGAPYSGFWWSTPAMSGLICSTRSLRSGTPVGLTLVEDAGDWTTAGCRAVQVRPGAAIFEIGGPEDWLELVGRYPLVLPRSRRHDWWRASGYDGHWAIPDYAAVAADYDGIHLSVIGYLSTAGRALHADGFDTVLAGWNPDDTWWLTDAAAPAGKTLRWWLDAEGTPPSWKPDLY